jgi:hypothetical protein
LPSSASNSLRLEEQFTGENVNLWGTLLNRAIAMLDDAIAGATVLTVTGDHILVSANYVSDEARRAILKFIGTPSAGFAITTPSVPKVYQVWNTTGQIATLTTGSGTTVAVQPGEAVTVGCDGANVARIQGTYFANQQISGVADPTSPQQVATMAYVTAQIMGAFSGSFPGQGGANGWALFSNGVTPLWKRIASTDLSDFNTNILGVQVALAVAL